MCEDTSVATGTFYIVVWCTDGITDRDRKKLGKLIKASRCILGCPLDPVNFVEEKRMLAKLLRIQSNLSNPFVRDSRGD